MILKKAGFMVGGEGDSERLQSSWSTLHSALRQVNTGPIFTVHAAATPSRRS